MLDPAKKLQIEKLILKCQRTEGRLDVNAADENFTTLFIGLVPTISFQNKKQEAQYDEYQLVYDEYQLERKNFKRPWFETADR